MKRIFRELCYFLFVFLVFSVSWALVEFSYERWPFAVFVGLSVALMYALFRLANWLSDHGGLQ